MDHVCPLRRAIRWGPLRQDLDLRRAISRHGLCAIDLPREPARRRGLPAGARGQALSHGLPDSGAPLDPGRCQRVTRLAYLCRVRPALDRPGPQALPQRGSGPGVVQHGLCARFDDDRPVHVDVSLGALSYHQVGREDTYAARSARRASRPLFTSPRQLERHACARSADPRAGGNLRDGPRLCRLQTSAFHSSGGRFLPLLRAKVACLPTGSIPLRSIGPPA